MFKAKGWGRVVGFQASKPPHLGHEYVQNFINPIIGKKKGGDFLDNVIIKAYKVLIKEYYPKNIVILSTFETKMRYAVLKEAIFHAIARKNYGCDYVHSRNAKEEWQRDVRKSKSKKNK